MVSCPWGDREEPTVEGEASWGHGPALGSSAFSVFSSDLTRRGGGGREALGPWAAPVLCEGHASSSPTSGVTVLGP